MNQTKKTKGFIKGGDKTAVCDGEVAVKRNAVYTECGWQAEVEILEDNSDSEKYSYKLKVIKTYIDGILGSFPDGYIFNVFASKRHFAYCGWRLE